MLLRPRKFTFKNRQKSRSLFSHPKNSGLLYGQQGLQILQPMNISGKNLFRIKLYIKKGARRADKTSRKVWLNAFPHLPLTKKVSGSRMGKGKGKLAGWYGKLPSGINLIEYRNLRNGRGTYFLRQIKFRLPVQSRLVFMYSRNYLRTPISVSSKVRFQEYF
jgi:large subunit ribosomal protein L16